MSTVALLFALSASTSPAADPATLAAIEATCHDYVDGQREADPQRVARSLHPDLAKRAVLGDTPDERLGLRRMSKEELVALTKQGALKTPKDQWDRRCTVLDVTGNAASVRLERRGSSITSTWGASTSAGSSSTRCGTRTEGEVSTMRAAGKAWVSVVVLAAGIALLPGLLYLLGLALVGGWPKPADRAPSGVAACSSEPRTGFSR